MIPTNNLLIADLIFETQPSKNHKMHFEDEVINGYRDKLEAMKQVVFKILNTERYQYIIYSWNYGIELNDLYGKSITYVCPELERRITEALIQDDRINSVDTFSFDISQKRIVMTTFVVHTIYGNTEASTEVEY